MGSFRDLNVYKKAFDLSVLIFKESKKFQMKRNLV